MRRSRARQSRERNKAPFGSSNLRVETKRATPTTKAPIPAAMCSPVSYMKSPKDAEAATVDARGHASCYAD